VKMAKRSKVDQLTGESHSRKQYWIGSMLETLQPLPVKSLACSGVSGAIMLLETCEVYGWMSAFKTPQKVVFPGEVTAIVQIAAGEDHFAARSKAYYHNMFTWGGNSCGQLGLGHLRDSHLPCAITSIEERVVDIACGNYYTLCFTELKTAYGWGSDAHGQLGLHKVEIEENGLNKNPAKARMRKYTTVQEAAAPELFSWHRRLDGENRGKSEELIRFQLLPSHQNVLQPKILPFFKNENDAPGSECRLDARGDHAVSWTRAEAGQNFNDFLETGKLKDMINEKKSRISDVNLRFQRVLNQWSRQTFNFENSSRVHFPSGACTSAELVMTTGALGTEEPTVSRDSALQSLENRTKAAQSALEKQLENTSILEQDYESTVSMMSDLQQETLDLQNESTAIRVQNRDIRKSLVDFASQLKSINNRIMKGIAGQMDYDTRDHLRHSIELATQDSERLSAGLRDLNLKRSAIDEKAQAVAQRQAFLAKELSKVELEKHQIETRIVLYQRVKLRRQLRLQKEYEANLRSLWALGTKTAHSIWKSHVLPADVFNIMDQQDIPPENEEEYMKMAQRAVQMSNELLEKAEMKARIELEKIRMVHSRLEVERSVVSRGGGTGMDSYNNRNSCSLSLNSSRVTMQHEGSQGVLTRVDLLESSTLMGEQKETTSHNRPLMLLTNLQYSAVVGDEIVIESVSVIVDGMGHLNEEHHVETNFGSQEIRAVVFESTENHGPGMLVKGGCSHRFRVSNGMEKTRVELVFPMPIYLFTKTARRGLGSCWVGIYVESPSGVVRVHGLPSKSYYSHTTSSEKANNIGTGLKSPASLVVSLPGNPTAEGPPRAIDLISDQNKHRSPIHMYLATKVLSTCDRCLRIIRDTIDQRRGINNLLENLPSVKEIHALNKSIKLRKKKPDPPTR